MTTANLENPIPQKDAGCEIVQHLNEALSKDVALMASLKEDKKDGEDVREGILSAMSELSDALNDHEDDEELDDEDEDEDEDEDDLLLSLTKQESTPGAANDMETTAENVCVKDIFLSILREDRVLEVVQSQEFVDLTEQERINYAVVASWGNYNQVAKCIVQNLSEPHKYWETLLRTLSVPVSYVDKFIEHVNELPLPNGWTTGASFDPCNKKIWHNMRPLLSATAWLTDDDVKKLVEPENNLSILEKIVLESVMENKKGTYELLMGVLIRALALNHSLWQTQQHPVWTSHTMYDVWKGLLNLKGYSEIDFWMEHYSNNPLQHLDGRSIVDFKIEYIISEKIAGPICGIEKDSTTENILLWITQRGNEQNKNCEDLWWNEQTRDLDVSNKMQSAYTKRTLSLLKNYTQDLNNPLVLTQRQFQHPLLDLLDYGAKKEWVNEKDVQEIFALPIRWDLYEDNPVADDLITKNKKIFLECHTNAPNVDDRFVKSMLVNYWLDTNTSDVFRQRTWNTLFGNATRVNEGPLGAAENALHSVLEKISIEERWDILCGATFSKKMLENPNLEDQVRTDLDQLSTTIPPHTLEQLQSHQQRIESSFVKFKAFLLWGEETNDQRILFTEKDVKAIIPELEKFKRSAEIFAFWEDFFKKNPSGLRRSARAQQALKNINRLRNGFPHFEKIVDMIENDLALAMMGKGDFFLPPMIMDGPPGTGKTFFFNELARVSQNDFHIFNMESVTAGPAFTGLDRMWSNTAPGDLFEKMIKVESTINPIILLDELDKTSDRNDYPVAPVLLSLLEPHSAKKFLDRSVPLKLDFSRITWVATSNDLKKVSAPILSRFRVMDVPSPNLDARIKMSRTIEEFLRRENLWGSAFKPVPYETLQVLCAPSGSARDLRKNLMHGFAQAARSQRNIVLPQDLPVPEKTPKTSPWNTIFEEIPQHLLENK